MVALKDLAFFTRSDLREAGKDSEGTVQYVEDWYVIAESSEGRRWAHVRRFPSHRLIQQYDDDAGERVLCVDPTYGEQHADHLCERIIQTQKQDPCRALDLSSWSETYAAYGSAAFSNEEMIEWERAVSDEEILERRGLHAFR